MRVRHPCLPALRVVILGLSLLAATMAGAETNTVPEPPPEPEPPPSAGLPQEERIRIHQTWRDEHAAWEANLTTAQVLMLEKREDEEYASKPSPWKDAQELPKPGGTYAWRETAERWKLKPEVLASLETHQLAFGDSVRQSFSPYLGGPVFITSDSALNAFHVLFEDSFRELELRRSEKLRRELETVVEMARKLATGGGRWSDRPFMPADRHARAMDHLERVLGPALVILGTPLEFFAENLRTDVMNEATFIREASSTSLPPWLGPPDPEALLAIDFRRCQPVGFYAGSTRLGAYFRAVRWLQLVPFRAARKHEFDAVVLFGIAAKERGLDRAFRSTEIFVGRGDDPTAFDLIDVLDNTSPRPPENFDPGLTRVRNEVVRDFVRDGYYRINSDLRSSRTVEETFANLSFRLMPAAAFPDSILFQQLMDRGAAPSGLAVAGLLGSAFALKRIDAPSRAVLLSEGMKLADLTNQLRRHDSSLYGRYLNTLETLFLPIEAGAPPCMQTEIWQAKSCQTALSGWAQMRHTFTLQAKMAQNYLGMIMTPPGFVEENPEFFARLARLIDQSSAAFGSAHCFEASAAEEADRITAAIARIREIKSGGARDIAAFSMEDHGTVWFAEHLVAPPTEERGPDLLDLEGPAFEARRAELVRLLNARVAALDSGAVRPEPEDSTLHERWIHLGRIVHTLEALAHKGLRAAPWSPEEEQFLRNYGEAMAFVMGYFGNSWLTPRDDAPRWAEVCGFPDRGASLVAAVGRPREIFVLHPWQGIDVLCRGSVMQYYEYESTERLTDEEWRNRLDAPGAPPLPEWFADYAQPPAFDPTKHH